MKRVLPVSLLLLASLVVGCGGDGGSASVGFDGPKTQVLPCDLLITEIMAKPSSPVSGRRWVEIYNASAEEIDLSRLRLRLTKPDTKPSEADLRAVGGSTVPAASFVWVRIDAEPLPEEMVAALHVLETTDNLAIPEDDFELAIVDVAGTVIHKVTFGPKEGVCDPASGILVPPAQAADQAIALLASHFSCHDATYDCGAWGLSATEAIPGDSGFGTPGVGPGDCAGGGSTKVPLVGQVALNEIMYRASDATGDADWIELKNISDDWFSLLGCVIGDGTASGDHTISEDVVVCPGELVVLASDDLTEFSGVSDYIFGGKPNLNQSGDRIYLKCPDEEGQMATLFDLDFTGSGPGFPAADDGASLQVCPELLLADATVADYHSPGNWGVTPEGSVMAPSPDRGTPGSENPSCGGEPLVPCEPPCTGGTQCVTLNGEGVCARAPAVGELVVTEFMTNASEACGAKKDWVEVYNLAADVLVLDGCELADDNDSTYAVPNGAGIAPGGYAVLVQNSDCSGFDAPNAICYGGSPNLNTGDDSFALLCGGTEIFRFHYGEDGEVDKPADGEGENRVAMQVGMTDGTTSAGVADNPANWCLATVAMACGDLATPGLPNSECGSGPVGDCDPPCGDGYVCGSHPEVGPVCARPPAMTEVVPTEIMTNGSDECSGGKDWFELLNLANDYVELKGCELTDDNDSTYAIDDSVVMAPGEFLAMVQGSDGCILDSDNFYCYGGSPNLNTSDDSLSLLCGGVEIFTVHYGEENEIIEPNGGKSAQVLATAATAQEILNSVNWELSCNPMACGEMGTPGAPNTTCN